MDVLQAIFLRQSYPKVKEDAVPRETIEKLLAAAVQAPNHHRIRPWRFVVLTGQARNRLGDLMAELKKAEMPDAPEAVLDIERLRPLRAPLLIAVGVDKPTEPKISQLENICASAAAVQNMLLAATALGLGAMWRTGPAALAPQVKEFLGFESDQHLIGFVYIGYPEAERPPVERPGFEDRTRWMD